jgi:hypothetical protein
LFLFLVFVSCFLFLALRFAQSTKHDDSALLSVSGYAQGSIHPWLMAIVLKREDAERNFTVNTQNVV